MAPLSVGGSAGYLNGSNSFSDHDAKRVQRGTGTSDIGGPRLDGVPARSEFLADARISYQWWGLSASTIFVMGEIS